LLSTNFNRIADGVIHFQVRAFDQNGYELAVSTNTGTLVYPTLPDWSNALPHHLEVELGLLEPETFERARALPPANQLGFLTNQSARVHIFRQQIAVHTAR
jgi:hypothetical protein